MALFHFLNSRPAGRYAVMLLALFAATALRFLLWPSDGALPFFTYYPTLILVAHVAGTGPGVVFIALSVLGANFFFLPPFWEFSSAKAVLVTSSAYVIACVAMLGVVRYHRNKAEHQALELRKELSRRTEAEKSALENERRLATKDEWLRLAIDGANGAGWEIRFDPERPGQMLDAMQLSTRHKNFIGYDDDTFPSSVSAWMARIHDEDRQAIHEGIHAHAEGRSPAYRMEYRIRHRDGNWRWIASNARVFRNAAGQPERCAGIDWDITERKVAEEKIKRISVMLSESQRIAHLGSFEYDARTRTTFWSEEEYRIYGLDPGGPSPTYEMLLQKFIHPDDARTLDEGFMKAIKTRSVYELEHRIIRPDGSVRWVYDIAHPYLDAKGNLLRYIGTTLDITERKEMEAVLRNAKNAAEDAAQSKAAFLANMSHEIRTPLHVIIGLAHLLVRHERMPAQLHRLEQLIESSEHLLEIINDILDFSKIDAGRLVLHAAPLKLEEVMAKVSRMLEMRAREKGLAFATEVADALQGVELMGDEQRLTQILINLGSNAIKFTDQGEVHLRIASLGQEAERVQLRVTVADTGIGIRQEDQQRIFDPFEQTDASMTRLHGGTGLGLAISQKLAGLMGSRIQVESEPGKGSVFSCDLVLQRAAEPTAKVNVQDGEVPEHFAGVRVLVAEDHPTSQEILLEMLDGLGCEVDLAADGGEALALVEKRSYDLVLMDMQMPRMDGLSATRAIRALPGGRDLPIVALTANAFAEDKQRCLEAGMSDYLSKPVCPDTLAATLARWLPGFVAPAETPGFDSEIGRALTAIEGLDIHPAWLKSESDVINCIVRLKAFADSEIEGLRATFGTPTALDPERAAFQAHQLKGIAAFLGVKSVQQLAGHLEDALKRSDDLTRVREIYERCEDEVERLRRMLQAFPDPVAH